MSSKHRFPRPPRTCSGFTIIEVLIAVFVLTVGLLGVAGMQMIGLKNNSNAALRTQAVFLAQDIADRMRANPAAVAADYTSTPSCPSSCSPASGCSPAYLAEYDRCAWDGAVDLLPGPGGQGQLTLVDAANNIYQARIMWDDRKTGATGTGCDPTDPDDMVCFDTQFRP